jgi:hypothetical protein
MRPSRRLGTLAAAAAFAAVPIGAPPAHAYFDTGHGRAPVYLPHAAAGTPAPDDAVDWPLIAVGAAAAVALTAAVTLRSAGVRVGS